MKESTGHNDNLGGRSPSTRHFSFSYLQADHLTAATMLQNLAYVVIDLTLSDEGVLYQDRVTVNLRNRLGWN